MSKSVLSNEPFLRLNKKVGHISKQKHRAFLLPFITFLKSLGAIDHTIILLSLIG